ncbi:MAG: hypothetical protein C5B49_03880 [Bdellovibrio sp.]|nr:MAG: hypothetical protein C5B49_03880 [Bdellovibrio sp.]
MNLKTLPYVLVHALIFPLLIVCCEKGGGGGGSGNPVPPANPVKKVTESVENVVADKDLQGSWESQCFAKPGDFIISQVMTLGKGSVKSSKIKYILTGSQVDRLSRFYSGANCQTEVYAFHETGSFKIDEKVNTPDGGKGVNFDFKKLTLKVSGKAGEDLANSMKLCGKSDWSDQAGEVDVTNHSREVSCYFVAVPRMNANLYKVDKAKNSLFLGTAATSETSYNQRPTALDVNEKYSAAQ